MSFRLKILIGVALIELVVMAVLIIVNQLNLGGAARFQLEERAYSTAQLFATMVSEPVISTDLATLDAMVDNTLLDDGIVYLRVRDTLGRTLSSGGDAAALARPFVADSDFESAEVDQQLDIATPVLFGGQFFGSVEMGMSTESVEREIAAALRWNITVASLGMGIVGVFGTMLGSLLTRQLSVLRDGAMQIEAGDLDHRVPVTGRDELAQTARSFNAMAASLLRDRQTIKARQNELLEQRAKTLEITKSMHRIALGDGKAEVAHSDRDDEIGEMARATIIFRDTMDAVATARHEQDRLIEAFERVAEEVAIFNDEGRVLFTNAAFRTANADILAALPTTFTYDTFLAMGLSMGDFPDYANADGIAALRAGVQRADGAVEIARANNRRVLFAETLVKGIGVIVTASDVTELRASQAQVIHASKLSTLGEMATGVAHELNQPLGVIRMAAGNAIRKIARGTDDPDYLTDKLQRIADQTERAAQIIDQMRIFGRKDDAVREPFDLIDGISTAAEMMRAQLSGAGIDLVEVYGCTNCAAFGSKVMFEQVIVNLLANARDAMATNAPGSLRRITISTERDAETGAALVQVTDTGGGIPADLLDRLFEPFFTTKATGQGTGLGLSISYGIVQEMGGELTVENGEEGAIFTARIPHFDMDAA